MNKAKKNNNEKKNWMFDNVAVVEISAARVLIYL